MIELIAVFVFSNMVFTASIAYCLSSLLTNNSSERTINSINKWSGKATKYCGLILLAGVGYTAIMLIIYLVA